MPREVATGQAILIIFPVAIYLTVLSTTVYKQPWDCGADEIQGTCGYGEQTAGFPFPALRDIVVGSPTNGFGRIDRSDWENGGLEIGGFLLNTLIYSCLLYALVFIYSIKE